MIVWRMPENGTNRAVAIQLITDLASSRAENPLGRTRRPRGDAAVFESIAKDEESEVRKKHVLGCPIGVSARRQQNRGGRLEGCAGVVRYRRAQIQEAETTTAPTGVGSRDGLGGSSLNSPRKNNFLLLPFSLWPLSLSLLMRCDYGNVVLRRSERARR